MIIVTATFVALFSGFAIAHADQGNNKFRLGGEARQIVIGEDGKVTVRGAKVTSVSGSTIFAGVVFGSTSFNWTVVTNASTTVITSKHATSTVGQIAIGDIVSFAGNLNTALSAATVMATVLEDWTRIASSSAATSTRERGDRDRRPIREMRPLLKNIFKNFNIHAFLNFRDRGKDD